ncbi:MFS transporter [Streptomyces sp. NPDC007851]|uniref:MFS transporter n=1 Tax=Streptomyces sp. NPDC007851 TaxID=3155008 RepID=UPI00340F879D
MTRRAPLPGAFRRLWVASGVSTFGDGVYLSALPLLSASISRDPAVLSLVTAAGLLPWLFFGLIGGALVDRWDRRRTMWIADAARATLLIAAVGGAEAGLVGVPLLIGVAFLLCIGQILFDTAATAVLPELLDRDPTQLQRANALLNGTRTTATGFLGASAGAALFTLGRTVPLLTDALSFLFSSLMIRSLPATPPRPRVSRRSLLADARAGASYLLHEPLLLGLSLRPALGNFAFSAGNSVFVLFAEEKLHLNPAGYGFLLSVQAVGGLVGTTAAGWIGNRLGIGGAMMLASVLLTGAQLGVGCADGPVPAGAAMIVRAAALGAIMVLGPSVRQAVVPDELMGRVAAAARLLALGAAPLGALLGGYLATVAGLRAPYLMGAAFLAVTTLVSATMTTNRRISAALDKVARSRQTTANEGMASAD